MANAIATREETHIDEVMEAVIASGDLSKLSSVQRLQWYKMRCEAVGLDPRTQPFMYVNMQGKLTLYATKTATEQLAQVRRISLNIIGRERVEECIVVTCRASPDVRGTILPLSRFEPIPALVRYMRVYHRQGGQGR
jgi:hypothetical protein